MKKRIELKNPDNCNEIFVTEIRNNCEVKFRESKTSFVEMTADDEETETITIKRKFLTSIGN